MSVQQIDLDALVSYVEETLDYSDEYEADKGMLTWEGQVIGWQRHPHHFVLFVGRASYELPR